MYSSSEDAMKAREPLSFARASAEIKRHGMEAQEPMSEAHAGDIFVREPGGEWETIRCNTRAILEWLGC